MNAPIGSPRIPAPFADTLHPRRSPSVLWKMGLIGLIALLLQIPLAMIRGGLSERLMRRDSAIRDITSTWGDEQIIAGPFLTVPYRYAFKSWKEQVVAGRTERFEVTETAVARATFLPARLEAQGELEPQILYRGIYRAVVYRSRLSLSGEFRAPQFDDWKVAPDQILWEDATVAFGVSDLRGAQNTLTLKWGEADIPLVPGAKVAELSGIESRLKLGAPLNAPVRFEVELAIQGSRGIRFAPVGESTAVQIVSTWPDPSFQGAFLPTERTVSSDGFEAAWNVSYYGRGYPQQWTDRDGLSPLRGAGLASSLLGVDLISLLDAYRYVERSIKYGMLFIALVFTAFFLFETLEPIGVHPFQYTLVGVALCLFYLALLSLSEFVSFGAAYGLGAVVSTLMIGWYGAAALHSGRRSTLLAAGVTFTYGFLYVILRLQDYSLLLGTAGLFLVLGLVMFATRKIDWYARENA